MTQFKRRGELPQLRSSTGRRPAGFGILGSRARLPQLSSYGARQDRPSFPWILGIGALALLILVFTAPIWLPVTSWIVPDRYIMAYAPQAIQRMIFQVDLSEQVPTAVALDDGQAQDLLDNLASTATPTPSPGVAAGAPGGYTQPTAVPIAPTATLTPVVSIPVDPRAEDRDNGADLGDIQFLLEGFDWEQQGYNNCGPASLRVMMSYWNVDFTEAEAASFLKPNAEDPNVRPDEMAAYLEQFDYEEQPYHILVRVNGDFDTLKQLIMAGYPVMIESGYDPEPDVIGWTSHYLTLVGFSDTKFIAMDTYRRPNWGYEYAELDNFWRQFNRRYLVAYRDDQAAAVASIVGENMNDETMYNGAVFTARAELSLDRNDPFGWFNLGSSLVALERYEDAALAFDEARSLGLPWRFLWYQFTPYEAYLQVGRYDDVIALADAVLEKKASEEAFYYKGLALLAQDDSDQARLQFTFALRANRNYAAAQQALDDLED